MKINLNLPIDYIEHEEIKDELKIIEGNFCEGQFVTVSINGDVVKRKVYYSASAGDLYIRYKNSVYFLYEFN